MAVQIVATKSSLHFYSQEQVDQAVQSAQVTAEADAEGEQTTRHEVRGVKVWTDPDEWSVSCYPSTDPSVKLTKGGLEADRRSDLAHRGELNSVHLANHTSADGSCGDGQTWSSSRHAQRTCSQRSREVCAITSR